MLAAAYRQCGGVWRVLCAGVTCKQTRSGDDAATAGPQQMLVDSVVHPGPLEREAAEAVARAHNAENHARPGVVQRVRSREHVRRKRVDDDSSGAGAIAETQADASTQPGDDAWLR